MNFETNGPGIKAWNFRAGSGGFRAILGFGKCSNYSLYFKHLKPKVAHFGILVLRSVRGLRILHLWGLGFRVGLWS